MSTRPGLIRSTSLQRPVPHVRASVPDPNVGMLTKGNRYHEDTAPQVRYEPHRGARRKPAVSVVKAEPQQRWGRMCVGCGEYLPPSAEKCADCWETHLAARARA